MQLVSVIPSVFCMCSAVSWELDGERLGVLCLRHGLLCLRHATFRRSSSTSDETCCGISDREPPWLPSVAIPSRSYVCLLLFHLSPCNSHLLICVSHGAKELKKATHISLVGDVVKRAGNDNCEDDREPGSTGSPLEVLVAVHLHLCGRS